MTGTTIGANRWPRSFLTRIRNSGFGDSWLARRFARAAAHQQRFPKPEPSDPGDPECAALLARIEAHEPDGAWALYRVLRPRTKEYVANHVSTKRWGDLLSREVQDLAINYTAPAQPAGLPIAPVNSAAIRGAEGAAIRENPAVPAKDRVSTWPDGANQWYAVPMGFARLSTVTGGATKALLLSCVSTTKWK